MATLAGRSIRTTITRLELVSDDEKSVLMIEHMPGTETTRIQMRDAWDERWDATGPHFNVKSGDLLALSAAITGTDVYYNRRQVEDIPTASHSTDRPDATEKAVEEALEAERGRCSELDLERAKAQTIAEQKALIEAEFILDHSRDKHIRGYVHGCPTCGNANVATDPFEPDDEQAPAA